MQATYRYGRTRLTADEVTYLVRRWEAIDTLGDTAALMGATDVPMTDEQEELADAAASLYGALASSPDSSTIAELADGAAPGFSIRYGTADMHVAAQVSYATNMTSVVSDVWGTHYLSDVAHFHGARFVGMDSPVAHGEANRTEGARKAHETRKANGKRTGRKPSCLCMDCDKCKARVRKQESRAAATLTGHTMNLPSIHVDA